MTFAQDNTLKKSTSCKRKVSIKTRKGNSKGKEDANQVHKTVKVDFNELSKEIFTPDKKFKHNLNWKAILKNSAHEMK